MAERQRPANECADCLELDALIAQYLEGEERQQARAELMVHVTSCRHCAELVRSLKRVVHYCRMEPGCDVPTVVHEELWQVIRMTTGGRRRTRT
ncbi:hypothetical protein FJY71_00100 [candidate division WOR-3 bacterium]|nr:hypothetical protein [candidate division WOR-3 bacterium]